MRIHSIGIVTIAALAGFATIAAAQSFDLSHHAIAGGGATFSTGGGFQLGGTIGQHDAGPAPMIGGGFELTGGLWPGMGGACTRPGDMNNDGLVDGADAQLFINCVLNVNGTNCTCADFNGGGATATDVPLFVAALLAG